MESSSGALSGNCPLEKQASMHQLMSNGITMPKPWIHVPHYQRLKDSFFFFSREGNHSKNLAVALIRNVHLL